MSSTDQSGNLKVSDQSVLTPEEQAALASQPQEVPQQVAQAAAEQPTTPLSAQQQESGAAPEETAQPEQPPEQQPEQSQTPAAPATPAPKHAEAPPAPKEVEDARKRARANLDESSQPYTMGQQSATPAAAPVTGTPPVPPQSQNLWQSWHKTWPGQTVDGLMHGAVQTAQGLVDADRAAGLATMNYLFGPQAAQETKDIQDRVGFGGPEKGFDKDIPEEEKESPTYKNATAAGEFGSTMAIPMGETKNAVGAIKGASEIAGKAVPMAKRLAEGAIKGAKIGGLFGAQQGAAQAVKDKDLSHIPERTAFGAALGSAFNSALGVGGGALLHARQGAADKALALGRSLVGSRAMRKQLHQVADNALLLADTIRRNSRKELQDFAKAIGPQPPANGYQEKQQQLLAVMDAWAAVEKMFAEGNGSVKAKTIQEQHQIDFLKSNFNHADTHDKLEAAVERRLMERHASLQRIEREKDPASLKGIIADKNVMPAEREAARARLDELKKQPEAQTELKGEVLKNPYGDRDFNELYHLQHELRTKLANAKSDASREKLQYHLDQIKAAMDEHARKADEAAAAPKEGHVEKTEPEAKAEPEVKPEAKGPEKQEEKTEEPEKTEHAGGLTEINMFAGSKKAAIEFPTETEHRLYVHAMKLGLMERDVPYPNSSKVAKSLAQDLDVKPDEVERFAKDYARRVNKQAEGVATKEGVTTKAPDVKYQLEAEQKGLPEEHVPLNENGEPTYGDFRFMIGREKGKDVIGHDVIGPAMSMDDPHVEQTLGQELFGRVKEAVDALGFAKAALIHAGNELKATAENALALAPDDSEIEKSALEPRLKHEIQKQLDKYRSELHLQQEEDRKAIQALIEEHERELRNAIGAAKRKLEGEIAELHHSLEKLGDPFEIFKVKGRKYLYGIAKAEDLDHPDYRSLAKQYPAALKQFEKARAQMDATELQWEKLKEHYKPVFDEADEAWKKNIGDPLSRLWVKTEIHDPFFPDLKTDFAIGLQHNALVSHLNEIAQGLHDKFKAELMKNAANVVTEYAYKLKGFADLQHFSNDELLNILREGNLLHPVAYRAMMMGGLGMTSLGLSASATDNDQHRNPEQGLFTFLGAATMVSAVAAKHGVPVTLRLFTNPIVTIRNFYENTKGLAAVADQAFVGFANAEREAKGLPLIQLTEHNSLQAQLGKLGGITYQAIMKSPDDARYFLMAAKHNISEAEIAAEVSPEGQELLHQVDEARQNFRTFMNKYAPAWHEFYKGQSPRSKVDLEGANSAVNFIDEHFAARGLKRSTQAGDRVLWALFTSLNKAVFGANLRLLAHMGEYTSVYLGTVVGPGPATEAAKLYATDSAIRGLVGRISALGGAHSEQVQDAAFRADLPGSTAELLERAQEFVEGHLPEAAQSAAKAVIDAGRAANEAGAKAVEDLPDGIKKPLQGIIKAFDQKAALPGEQIQAHLGMLGSMINYAQQNEQALRAEGINTTREFLQQALTGKLPAELNAEMAVQLWADMADFLPGADPTGMVRGPVGRMVFGRTWAYFRYPENATRLLTTNALKGPKGLIWMAGAYGMLLTMAGPAVIPQEVQVLGQTIAPEHMAKVIALLKLVSIGTQTVGDMNHYMSTAIVPLLQASQVPVLDSLHRLMSEYPNSAAELGQAIDLMAKGKAGTFLGNPRDKANQQAEKALHTINGLLWFVAADIAGAGVAIGTTVASNALYNTPALTHGVARVKVPNRIDVPGAKLAEPEHLFKLKGIEGSPITDLAAELATNSETKAEAMEKLPGLQPVAEAEAATRHAYNQGQADLLKGLTGGAVDATPEQINTAIEGLRNVLDLPSSGAVGLHQTARGIPGSHHNQGLNELDHYSGLHEAPSLE